MHLYTKRVVSLGGLPVEIILEIYQQLDITSIYKLCLVSKDFLNLLRRKKAMILLPVLMRDFSPFDELLQLLTASAEDLDVTDERYQPQTILLRRFPGDEGYTLTPYSESSHSLPQYPEKNGFSRTHRGQTPDQAATMPKIVTLTDNNLDSILKKCFTIQQWEEIFPQMRWYHEPENCRSLRLDETRRFRRALYRWWLYGIYFHSDLPRPHVGLPTPFARDIRTSLLRYHSSIELLELLDLIETIKDVILHYICPRLDPCHLNSDYDMPLIKNWDRTKSLMTGFIDQTLWGRIVKTYVKLGPEELMYYFDNICSYPRKRLVSEIHLRHPNFTLDQESIQVAIRCVLDERDWLEQPPSLPEASAGGIIDFDDKRDYERLTLGDDASPDGLPASGAKLGVSQSQYSPRGDDGSNLEGNVLYQIEMEERLGPNWMATSLGGI